MRYIICYRDAEEEAKELLLKLEEIKLNGLPKPISTIDEVRLIPLGPIKKLSREEEVTFYFASYLLELFKYIENVNSGKEFHGIGYGR